MRRNITDSELEELGLTRPESRDLMMKLNNAIHRCYKSRIPNHVKHYQDKGIEVCQEWKESKYEFIKWASRNGYKKGLEFDRIDNSKGYHPDNCRFVDIYEGRRNRTTCRSFDEKNAARLLRDNGFSEVFIKEHFPGLHTS